MAEEDMGVEDNDLAVAVYGVSRVSIPDLAILVSVAGCDYDGCSGHDILLRYDSIAVKMICSTRLTGTAMSFGPKPYYWPTDANYGSSPPLATRTGWMALGLLPFVLGLSAKANMISALTGIPHEKLQVFHHWTSYAMFVLALIHTLPFIVYHIWKGDMVKQWNTSVVYWTGVVAILAQAYLTVMSLPFIR